MEKYIETQINEFRADIRSLLPDYNEVCPKNAARTFLAYDSLIRPNFIKWLMLVQSTAKTETGKKVVQENLECEIRQNHPQLLLDVTVHILKQLSLTYSHIIQKSIDQTEQNIIETNRKLTQSCLLRVEGFFLMCLLENASIDFIPWMKEVALHKLNVQDLTYFELHGPADIEHASEFKKAFIAEANAFVKENLDQQSVILNIELTLRHVRWEVYEIFKEIFSYAQKKKPEGVMVSKRHI